MYIHMYIYMYIYIYTYIYTYKYVYVIHTDVIIYTQTPTGARRAEIATVFYAQDRDACQGWRGGHPCEQVDTIYKGKSRPYLQGQQRYYIILRRNYIICCPLNILSLDIGSSIL